MYSYKESALGSKRSHYKAVDRPLIPQKAERQHQEVYA